MVHVAVSHGSFGAHWTCQNGVAIIQLRCAIVLHWHRVVTFLLVCLILNSLKLVSAFQQSLNVDCTTILNPIGLYPFLNELVHVLMLAQLVMYPLLQDLSRRLAGLLRRGLVLIHLFLKAQHIGALS